MEMKAEINPGIPPLGATPEKAGQLWALVLATDAVESGAQSHLEPIAALSLVRDALNRAAAVVDDSRICLVISQENLGQLHAQRWHLVRSNMFVEIRQRGTAHGVLLALIGILQRDAAARVVLLPSRHQIFDEMSLRGSLRYAAVRTTWQAQEMLILGIEPEPAYHLLPGVPVGRSDRRGAFEVAPTDEGRVLRDPGILAGPADGFLQLIERRLPDIVTQARAAVAQGAYSREETAANALLATRLRGLDFHRDVLAGQERHLRVVPVPRR